MAKPHYNPCPPTFKTPKAFLKKMLEFFVWAEENNRVPYLIEYANFCMITTNTLDGYKHKPGFEVYYQLIKQKAHSELLHRGLNKLADARFAKFVLVNHENYISDNTPVVEQAQTQGNQKIEIVLAQPPIEDK